MIDNESKLIEETDKVSFEDLRKIMNIDDSESFKLYIDDIFKELSNKRISSKGNIGINKKSFFNFVKLPIFIAEKVFESIVRGKDDIEVIQIKEFSKFLTDLYMGSFTETAILIFRIYDFDSDGLINLIDVKHLLSFLPLKDFKNKNTKEYIYQIESLIKLSNFLTEPFHGEQSMNFAKFLEEIEVHTEIFLQLLCFLYITLPITSDSLWIYERITKKSTDSSAASSTMGTPLLSPRISLISKTNFSPMGDYLRINNTPVTRMKMKLNKIKANSCKTISPSINRQKGLTFIDKITDNSKKLTDDKKQKLDFLKAFSTNTKDTEIRLAEGSVQKPNKNSFKNLASEDLKSFPLRGNTGNDEKKISFKNEEDIPDDILEENIAITPFDKSIYTKKTPQILNKQTILEEDVEAEEDEKELSKCKSRKTSNQNASELLTRTLRNPGSKKTSKIMDDEKKLRNPSSSKNSTTQQPISEKMELENDDFVNQEHIQKTISNGSTKYEINNDININLKDFLINLSLNDKNLEEDENEEQISKLLKEEEIKREKRVVMFQSELLKFKSEKKTFKIFFIKLIHQNIYYYKSQNDPEESYYKMHYLSDCYVSKLEPKVLKNTVFYSFSINFSNNKMKKYYHLNEEIVNNWVNSIQKATNYKNFFDFYSVGDYLGKGQFGLVKVGINLKTQEKVALKILTKSEITSSEGLKTEIDILKVAKHPNIVQFLDYFEDNTYIFIVMEYLRGGTLDEYLKKVNWRITEKETKKIVVQICQGLSYLNQFGIIHRDLKLNNIMLNNLESEEMDVKIMDFGLSKILGPSEKAKESCGTLSYIAPEIILRKPYNSQVDIWSLGVLLYYILSKELPFDLPSNNFKEICNVILTKKLSFSEKFNDKSVEVQDFISKCLIRDPDKRIKIDEVLNHKWFSPN